MLIANEYNYVEEIMKNKICPKEIGIRTLLIYIAKYYYSPALSVTEYVDLVLKKAQEFELDPKDYQEYKYISFLKGVCKKILTGDKECELRQIENVVIYESELDIINKGETDREKKILFTLYILAKINPYGNGWVNNSLKEIFNLANVTASTADRAKMMYKLYSAGLIEQNHKNDVLAYKVNLGKETENTVITISQFKNLGNQYLAKFKPGWKMCICCGKMLKIKGGNTKYCKSCAREKELEKYLRYNEKR